MTLRMPDFLAKGFHLRGWSDGEEDEGPGYVGGLDGAGEGGPEEGGVGGGGVVGPMGSAVGLEVLEGYLHRGALHWG